jgi:hypothetical protein
MVATLVAGALMCGMAPVQTAAQTVQDRTVTLAILPPQTTVDDLAQVNGMAVGLMSTGIGEVPPEQTYLDISQGNRVNDVLYDRDLPALPPFYNTVPGWEQIVARANSAPADLYPGLLAGQSDAHDFADPSLRHAALTAANRPGFVSRRACAQEPCRLLRIVPMSMGAVRALSRGLPPSDMLIALVAPTGDEGLTPIGIAGQGFHGELTSDSTRTDGYVLSTDLLPTVLRTFGSDANLSLYGVTEDPIRGEGAVDAGDLTDLGERMSAIPDRREPILVACILAWLLVALAVSRIVVGLRRVAMAWLAICFAYMPLLLMGVSCLEPSAVAEGLLVGLGSALLAALTLRFAPGWRGLAIACTIAVIAYAIDVIAGSDLTKLSLLGPNPIFGARFYGIGNELEALFAVMVPMGVGAGLSAWGETGKTGSESEAVAVFLGIGLLAALVFAAGPFGADVGAAIVLPVGAVVAAGLVPGGSVGIDGRHTTTNLHGRAVTAVIAAPILVVAVVALIDLISGGNSHLTRSVLDAGGASDLADVAQRRLELSAHDFAQAAGNPLFWLVIAGVSVSLAKWRRIDAWLRPAPLARAGFLGACAAVAIGVFVNDSGATFLVLGSLALGATLAFAWAQAPMGSVETRVMRKPQAGE